MSKLETNSKCEFFKVQNIVEGWIFDIDKMVKN